MKKRLLALAVTPLLMLGVASCTGGGTSSSISPTTPISNTSSSGHVDSTSQVSNYDKISDANSKAGTYKVHGLVVGTSEKALLVRDETGVIMIYLNAVPTQAIGDYVEVSGTVAERNDNYQFTSSATITPLTGDPGFAPITPEAYTCAQWDAYDGKIGPYVSVNVEVYQEGSYINFNLIPGEGEAAAKRNGSFSYPPESFGVDTTDAIGDQFTIEGFLVETNSGKTRNTLLVTKATKTKEGTVASTALVDVTFSKDELGGCEWLGQYSVAFYANGSLKTTKIGEGIKTPSFDAQNEIVVTLSIASFNNNQKAREGDTDALTFKAYNASNEVVATESVNPTTNEPNIEVTLAGQGMTYVEVTMTNYISIDGTCQNIGIGRIVVDTVTA